MLRTEDRPYFKVGEDRTCNDNITIDLARDVAIGMGPEIGEILSAQKKVLIYTGDKDYAANYYG